MALPLRACVQKSVCKVYILVLAHGLALYIIKDLVGKMLKYVFIVNYSPQSGIFNWWSADSWSYVKVSLEVPRPGF